MEFLSSRHRISLNPTATSPSEDERTRFDENGVRLDEILASFLLTENLIVLAGLGTSLGDGDGLGPNMNDLWEGATQGVTKLDELKSKVKYVKPDRRPDNIELLLSACNGYLRFNDDAAINAFVKKAKKVVVDKCRFVKHDTKLADHESFIRKLARRSTRLPRTKLFTTNYDLAFEVAASRTHFVAVDGFAHTTPQEFDGSYFDLDMINRKMDGEPGEFISNLFHLLKLHGSVDWEFSREAGSITRNPAAEDPVIIYPEDTKYEYSYRQPFFEMMSRLQASLRFNSVALLVIGFGFNDDHIALPIRAAVDSNVNLKILVVAPDVVTNSENEHTSYLKRLMEDGDNRIMLMPAKFSELVQVIPDLNPQSQDDRHRERIHKLSTPIGTHTTPDA